MSWGLAVRSRVVCSCYLCTGADPGRDTDIVADVTEHGWSVVWVPGDLTFAYTVGLWHTFGLPEVAMFGLGGPDMQNWLNTCVDVCQRIGWPADGQPLHGVLDGFSTQLKGVHESWRPALFGSAGRFYQGAAAPVRQLVWPDRHGIWPWQPAVAQSCRNRQASAWLPVAEHPAGGWRLVGEHPDFPFDSGRPPGR
jgi:hypothetical protein